ncbi:hypothetical protein Q3O60_10810 [Alkalimonas collagenimarina]|uniref:DUF6795 domain-containing protein n=1 Tax=Alkalimonas collagenimarina TaxID=400390 RepID=A0ABT9H067_9GAMM|nr:DUF6795 domain-containing protein [Alkalimonas collagenimarina]MDP4536681.1 hypothetical protein [Alkalimonas collagenimarina]
MFGWLKRTEVQWSPEIRGVITEHGKPVAGLKVTRTLDYDNKVVNDHVVTDHEGRFSFARKTKKIHRVLFDSTIGLFLSVADYPTPGQELYFFDIRSLNDLNGQALDLIMSDMHCELTAEEKNFSLKNLETPEGVAPWLSARCTFTHASTALYSDDELELQRQEREHELDEQERLEQARIRNEQGK